MTDRPPEDLPSLEAARTAEDLSRLLRELRRRDARQRGDAPFTYRQMASKTGWSFTVISQYFTGAVLPPTDRFDDLVRLLGATPAEQRAFATARDRVEEQRRAARAGGDLAAPPRSDDRRAARPGPEPFLPRALPAPVPHFTGRSAEVRALNALLATGGIGDAVVIAVIGGTAGVGKTALAVHWARRVADRFPDGQLYLNLRGFDPSQRTMDPAEAVRCVLDALRVSPRRIPASLDGQISLYRSLLAGRQTLIVLDNARDAGQVRPLLPGDPGSLVLVTSRNQLPGLVAADGAHPIMLDLLSPSEAWDLLARRLGSDRMAAESDAVEEIVSHSARLPLALAIVAARAVTRPGSDLRGLATELRDTQRRWAVLSADDAATDVETVFSWSHHALTPAAARLFRVLGLHPGPDISEPAIVSLTGLAPAGLRPLLDELARANLVAQPTPGRHAMHDLLRDYAARLAQTTEPAQPRRDATRRLLDHYLHSAYAGDRMLSAHRDPITLGPPAPGCRPEIPADHGQALDWFNSERAVLLAAVNLAATTGWDTHTWQLAWSVATYLDRQGHPHDWIAATRAAVAAARRLADPSVLALAHRQLARAAMKLGRLDAAEEALRTALAMAERSGDRVEQAHIHLTCSDLGARRGHLAEALDHARRALCLYRACHHLRGQTDALNSVGWYLAHLGEYDEAINHCEQALRLHEELGPGIVLATTWDSLGYAHHHLGQHTRSVICYRHALDMFRELSDRYSEAETLTSLGEVLRDAGDPAAARETWRRALVILDDLDDPDADEVRARLRALDA